MESLRYLKLFLIGIALAAIPARADELFDIKPVASGVYAAIAGPTFRPNGNAVIIVLEHSVLLVDTEAKPSAAEEVIAYIKHLTDKPLEYIVITHFHADHTQGASTYLKEWPQAKIISSEATRNSIILRGRARMGLESVNVPKQIVEIQSELGRAADPIETRKLKKQLAEANLYEHELKDLQIVLPTITVAKGLQIEDKTHPVEVLFLGKAHTDGDLFVFLPKDKILITGDALQSLTPTMRDCYPLDWIRTLQSAEKLEFDTVIGGHGDPFHGKETFELWEQYFADLLDRVAKAYKSGATLDQTRKQLATALIATYGDRFPKRFSTTVTSNIEKAYRFASGDNE
jgi:glyoxylase-like metal-dependent hydrolase (beta-lactamase superfamily II)